MIFRVDLEAQYRAHKNEIIAAVTRVLESGRYTLGPEVETFEKEFAGYIGVEECVGVADGTRAISMVLRFLGVKEGDEVITTAFTAIPTIGAIMEVGAVPVFVDIDEQSWLIDIDKIASKLSSRTRAILPVHMFGNVVDIPKVRKIVGDVPIIEDAAQAHGSMLSGCKAGSMGDFATFSFYPTKNLGGYGDGGAIVTNNNKAAKALRAMRNHGMIDKDTCIEGGFNSRLDEIQAAILRIKLKHLDGMNEARALRVNRYKEALPSDKFVPQHFAPNVKTNHHLLQFRYTGDRDALVQYLDKNEIQSNVYYVVPHHLQPALQKFGYKSGDLPNLEKLCAQAIALPLYPELPLELIEKVVDVCLACARVDT